MASGWHTHIDGYCERTDFSFWSEPINAVTNAAFLIAAAIVLVGLLRRGRLEAGTGLLLAILTAIGVGSFLFHTFATRWAALADVLPIALFILTYLVLTLRRAFALAWLWAGLIGVAFLPASGALAAGIGQLTQGALGGSSGYVPALLALAVCAGLLWRRQPRFARGLLVAAGLFLLSLTFRTLDAPLCQAIPSGTHFMWHVLNGTLLGWLIWVLAHLGPPASASNGGGVAGAGDSR
jgi:hypothetical protein